MQEIVTIKANIDTLMGYTEPGRKQAAFVPLVATEALLAT